MSDDPAKPLNFDWEPGAVVDWLLEEGRFLADADELVRQLGHRMLVSGAPLWIHGSVISLLVYGLIHNVSRHPLIWALLLCFLAIALLEQGRADPKREVVRA